MTYAQALRYLYSFLNLEKVSHFEYKRELNIERMKMLAGWFDHPEQKYPSILVGGTKGKGSTAVFLQSILHAAGFKVGLYTSPHLLNFRERVRINGILISKPDLTKLVSKIKRTVEKRRREIKKLEPITFFEMSTLLAFLYFAEKKVDWAVLEVGMGGRLDATTIVNPNLSVMTPISLDHREHLGSTIAKIAQDKSMIIRRHTPFISAKQESAAKSVLLKRSRQVNARGAFSGKDFQYQIKNFNLNGSIFDFQMKGKKLSNCRIRMAGDFQIENASVAIASILTLRNQMKLQISNHQVHCGLSLSEWPGRLEVIYKKSRIFILDGAHNDASMAALMRNIRKLFPKKTIQVIFGASREKELKPMFKTLASCTEQIIFTKAKQPRAQDIKVMLEEGKPHFHAMIPAVDIKEALAYSSLVTDIKTITIITGSLFLVAEAEKILKS